MTNPTRTRAEIQAEIEKLQKQMEEAWPQKGAQAYCKAEVADSEDDDAEILIDGTGCFTTVPLASLIPAADLIPREEHERAVAEAHRDWGIEAVSFLVKQYILAVPFFPAEPDVHTHTCSDGSTYRVTVERVDATDAHPVHPGRPHDYDQGYPPDDKPADAEPVAWANIYHEHKRSYYYTNEDDAKGYAGPDCIEVAVPLYRRPFDPVAILECAEGMSAFRHGSEGFIAYRKRLCGLLGVPESTDIDSMNLTPMPRAVAPVGVVDTIRKAAHNLMIWYEQHMHDRATAAQLAGAREVLNAALSRITELPKPSEWARGTVSPLACYDLEDRLDLAAALLAKEGE